VDLTSLLTEIEHYDGLVVMVPTTALLLRRHPLTVIASNAFSEFQATNRPYDLDEAMYRYAPPPQTHHSTSAAFLHSCAADPLLF
jgi:hypothetical protein